MQDKDKPTFMKLMTEMESCYPSTPHDEFRLAAYWSALKQYSLPAVRTGMVRASSDSIKASALSPRLPAAIVIAEHAKALEKTINQNPDYELKALTTSTEKIKGLPFNNPFEMLARKWEDENARGNPDCSKRASEIYELLSKTQSPMMEKI